MTTSRHSGKKLPTSPRKAENEKRFRLVSDDDGHDYVIPADTINEFYSWVRYFAENDSDNGHKHLGGDFSQYRLGCAPSCYTFTDFREDR